MTTPSNTEAPPAWTTAHMEEPPAWTTAGTSASSPAAVAQPTVEQHEEELFAAYSTLDEPVMDTIMRDVRAVAAKLKVVMKPLDRAPFLSATYAAVSQGEQEAELSENDRYVLQQLKDWDLWGPLVLCLALGIILSFRAPDDQTSIVFAAVFLSVWVGGTIVTINVQLLGGSISFFQSLCVLGYSTFPLVLAALAIFLIPFSWNWLDFLFVLAGFLWASRTSAFFISLYIRPERRFLALYPMFFLYCFMGWVIFLF